MIEEVLFQRQESERGPDRYELRLKKQRRHPYDWLIRLATKSNGRWHAGPSSKCHSSDAPTHLCRREGKRPVGSRDCSETEALTVFN
jgi:hypothetical protein